MKLHAANLHQGNYDFKALCACSEPLKAYLRKNPKGLLTIDFSDADAVLALNQALLKFYYHVDFWQIPKGYLCPPIPGRADYIHYLADLLAKNNDGKVPEGKQIKVLDIGVGANCIYPIIGSQRYGWSFVGSDIDIVALKTAELISHSNTNLKPFIKLRLQKNKTSIFESIIKKGEKFTLTLCNPPFHASMQDALAGSQRKVNNLNKQNTKLSLNFGGQENELVCAGGELAFLKQMCVESKNYGQQVEWFSSLVSKSENISPLKKLLEKLQVKQIEVIKMNQGQKISRLIAWHF